MKHERTSGNEFDFIDWVKTKLGKLPPEVLVGPGDDCAVIHYANDDQILLKTDSLLEGVHVQFSDPAKPGYATPEQAGYKVMARSISDVAAMGGVPCYATIATALPQGRGPAFREGLLAGLQRAAHAHNTFIIGGDTKSWSADDKLVLSVHLFGDMQGFHPVLRSGAREGDAIFVTGELGGSILGKHVSFAPRVGEGRWFASVHAHAMIDLSDGLSGDLLHICKASGVGALIEAEKLPVSKDALILEKRDGMSALEHALHDGEDFELLVCIAREKADEVQKTWPFATKLTRIGTVTEKAGGLRISHGGKKQPLPIKAYEHEL
ncbi:MAG: thiamine-monophosphate kinase [Planctomycetaceae bacterium]|nr:thiamine-monophosphate kinase [Planctomycetaceae bacterium]